MTPEHEFAGALEDLNGGAAAAGMRGEFLTLREREKDCSEFVGVEHRAAENACCGRLGCSVELEHGGFPRREQCLGFHAFDCIDAGGAPP